MPGVNGINFFQDLKKKSKSLPPFLFYSGLSELPLKKPFPEGIIGFIQKPFSLEEIMNIIPEELKPVET
jgi:FixJ family two-component response regulator